MNFPMIASRVFGTPLLVDPAKGAAFLTGIGPRITGGVLELRGLGDVPPERAERATRQAERASLLTNDLGDRRSRQGRSLYRVQNGVAVIEVTGTLVHRGEWIGQSSGATSYEGLVAQITAAGSDPTVRGVALEVDSFGGEVSGVFDLADQIRDLRAQKPVWAFVAEAALSAGYAIASQADRIVLPRTGEVGSIGVLWIHADHSQQLEDQGVAVTLVHAGSHKVDGNPFATLPEEVRSDMQARVEETRDLFVQTVAAGRGGRLTAAAALATEAQVYRGRHAVAAGLADEVGDLRKAFASFVAEVNGSAGGRQTTAAQAAQTKGNQVMNDEDQALQPDGVEAASSQPATGDAATVEETGDADRNEIGAKPDQPTEKPAASGSISTEAAAELFSLGQQAARLGVAVDVADALQRGVSADALRRNILAQLADRGDEADVVSQTPAVASQPKTSPLIAAAKSAVEAMKGP